MFFDFPQDFKQFQPAPGILVYMVSGQNIMFSHVNLQPGAVAPLHNHSEDRWVSSFSGKLSLLSEMRPDW